MTAQDHLSPRHPETTRLFVPLTAENSFVYFVELASARRSAYAFTSEAKTKEFLRVMHEAGQPTKVNRLMPCTLAEWKDRQTKKAWPNVWIDADPHALVNSPAQVSVDPERQNISCLTTEHPEGKIYRVNISPRTDGYSS